MARKKNGSKTCSYKNNKVQGNDNEFQIKYVERKCVNLWLYLYTKQFKMQSLNDKKTNNNKKTQKKPSVQFKDGCGT